MIKALGTRNPVYRRIMKGTHGVSPYHEFSLGKTPSAMTTSSMSEAQDPRDDGHDTGRKEYLRLHTRFAKGRWHLRAGTDRSLFASILCRYSSYRLSIHNILDGIRGMCGTAVERDAVQLASSHYPVTGSRSTISLSSGYAPMRRTRQQNAPGQMTSSNLTNSSISASPAPHHFHAPFLRHGLGHASHKKGLA